MTNKPVQYSVVNIFINFCLSSCPFFFLLLLGNAFSWYLDSLYHDRWFHDHDQIDAFTDSAFKGNPAAVCLLEEERDERWMQLVAAEFNFSDTAFLSRIGSGIAESENSDPSPRFSLRWFTPVDEVRGIFFFHRPFLSYTFFLNF